MGLARSGAGFVDCATFMQDAIKHPKGWSMTFADKGPATNFRLRCYAARRRQLRINEGRTFEHIADVEQRSLEKGKTDWDGLVFLVKEVNVGWAVMALHDGKALIEAQIIEQGPIEDLALVEETESENG